MNWQRAMLDISDLRERAAGELHYGMSINAVMAVQRKNGIKG